MTPPDFFGPQEFNFACPHCKKRIRSTVNELKRSDQKCPHCGAKFETADFRRGVDEANREIESFKKSLSNIKISIKI